MTVTYLTLYHAFSFFYINSFSRLTGRKFGSSIHIITGTDSFYFCACSMTPALHNTTYIMYPSSTNGWKQTSQVFFKFILLYLLEISVQLSYFTFKYIHIYVYTHICKLQKKIQVLVGYKESSVVIYSIGICWTSTLTQELEV